MPSPVGHALGGLIVGLAVAPKNELTARTHQTDQTQHTYQTYLAACAIAACAPDVDFLWGRHSMETHSLFVAGAVGAAVWAISRCGRLAAACALAWASHVLLDWLGSDTTPPIGVMALWPFTTTYYFADAFVFEAISRRYALPGFWWHNLGAVAKELLILMPPATLLWFFRNRETRRT